MSHDPARLCDCVRGERYHDPDSLDCSSLPVPFGSQALPSPLTPPSTSRASVGRVHIHADSLESMVCGSVAYMALRRALKASPTALRVVQRPLRPFCS